ncbi:MAG TPA: DUF3500 domain-containing protein [Blastocatellia bacterium]|nr:DUF3500 domain-containing protein [Blastocatellia bacterium]
MKSTLLIVMASTAALLSVLIIVDGVARSRSAAAMAEAANAFLAALTPEQRAKATFDFADEQRLDWHFVPRDRKGLPFKEMTEEQRKLAHNFLKTGLSHQIGYRKVNNIIGLELVLREIEGRAFRDPELYYFTIFGTPSAKEPWGWRFEGHHLSLNYTVVGGRMVATSPAFMGANPAEVRQGPQAGLRALDHEEGIARQLMATFSEEQRAAAIFNTNALPDIVTMNAKQVDPLQPVGIPAARFNERQMNLLTRLILEYANNMPDDLAQERMEKIRRAGHDKIWFGWAGGTEKNQPHYYRVQGPTFLIEYDNTQNNANHIHSVWRDFNGDFGRDLLREHYQNTPHKPPAN